MGYIYILGFDWFHFFGSNKMIGANSIVIEVRRKRERLGITLLGRVEIESGAQHIILRTYYVMYL